MTKMLTKEERDRLREEIAGSAWSYRIAHLLDEIDQLEEERDRTKANALAVFRDLEAARAVLRQVEWKGEDRQIYPACPSCGKPTYDSGGHAADCDLAAALGGR